MDIQEAYDSWSHTYDTDRNLTRDLDQVITKRILIGLDSPSIVEIGCGTGKNTLWLSQIAERVHAIDSSRAMLEKARTKVNSTNVTFTVGDITKTWICNNASADLQYSGQN
jgi:ubiquinone/menaquinone biosynthesis C-methylase UbiE